ncbi:hypothetical protein [Rhodopila sp.]|uniref:hypothetical protein n=1 Tax=Rhodopila sp. TaxID=2480087 RepID=UPI003D10DFCC
MAFFIRLHARNVGKSAAQNVIYWIAAADFSELGDADKWFEDAVNDAVAASRGKGGASNDSLAPSEAHKNRRWCTAKAAAPDKRPHWKSYELCVCVVAAYMGEADTTPFYTAKVFPIGFPDVPVFQKFISPAKLPIGTGDVGFGPVRKAKSS